MSKLRLLAIGLPMLAFGFLQVPSPAQAACDCSNNGQCSTGYYCKPIPGGCGHAFLNGWCTKLNSGGGGGGERLDLPFTSEGKPQARLPSSKKLKTQRR